MVGLYLFQSNGTWVEKKLFQQKYHAHPKGFINYKTLLSLPAYMFGTGSDFNHSRMVKNYLDHYVIIIVLILSFRVFCLPLKIEMTYNSLPTFFFLLYFWSIDVFE